MEFKFPDVGEGIHEGEVVEWLVKEGDEVKEDQDIVKVETDKAVVELPSPYTGTVLRIHVKEGEVVKVGETLVEIGSKGEKPKKAVRKSTSVVGELEEAKPKKSVKDKLVVTIKDGKVVPKKSEVKAMPAVRKLAKEMNVDLSKVKGSGEGGRILESDLKGESSEEKKVSVAKKYDTYGYVDKIPLKGMRKKIKENMEVQAKIPMVTHMDEVDVTKLWDLRQREKVKVKVKLTLLPFVIKAVVAGLKDYPILNSTLGEDAIIVKKYYNIGIAVATDDGLMVPVVKGVDKKSMVEIAKEIEALAERARKRVIDLQDLKGSCFTITNVGSIGGLFANPILNTDEAAILALGRMYDKAVVVKGNVKVRKVLPLSLTFDHRILDGAHAALFVNKVKEYLSDPDKLLLEMS